MKKPTPPPKRVVSKRLTRERRAMGTIQSFILNKAIQEFKKRKRLDRSLTWGGLYHKLYGTGFTEIDISKLKIVNGNIQRAN